MKEVSKMIRTCRGVTFIELMVTIVVVGILLAMLLAGLERARASALRSITVTKMNEIQSAVKAYHHDWEAYPTTVQAGFFTALTTQQTNTGGIISGTLCGPYMETNSQDSAAGRFLDAWDNQFRYQALNNAQGFQIGIDIISNGPDGVNNGIPPAGDDIQWSQL